MRQCQLSKNCAKAGRLHLHYLQPVNTAQITFFQVLDFRASLKCSIP